MSGCIPIFLLKGVVIRRTAEDHGLNLVELETAGHTIQRGLPQSLLLGIGG